MLNLEEAVKSKKELLENNDFDFEDILEIEKTTVKSYNTGREQISFELALALGGPNIWATISENRATISGYWGGSAYSEAIENENLYDYLLEMCC